MSMAASIGGLSAGVFQQINDSFQLHIQDHQSFSTEQKSKCEIYLFLFT